MFSKLKKQIYHWFKSDNPIEFRWRISYLFNGILVVVCFIVAIIFDSSGIIWLGLSLAGLIEGFVTIKQKTFFYNFPFGKITGVIAVIIGITIILISLLWLIFLVIKI
jgi:hypothetical protein